MDYTDTERRILDMWPKYGDGEYVWIGDDVSGMDVRSFVFTKSGVMVTNLTSIPAYGEYRKYGEPLKRPAPKALDADGVEIKVGDRVYSIENGNSYTVRSVNGSGTIELEGSEYKGWSSKRFTHTQPAIDADGVLIKIGDTVWVDGVSESCEVAKVENVIVQVQYADGDTFECCSSDLTHKQPDSWERLEEDARQLDIDLGDTTDDYPRMSCCRDLVRRAKALAEKEAAR